MTNHPDICLQKRNWASGDITHRRCRVYLILKKNIQILSHMPKCRCSLHSPVICALLWKSMKISWINFPFLFSFFFFSMNPSLYIVSEEWFFFIQFVRFCSSLNGVNRFKWNIIRQKRAMQKTHTHFGSSACMQKQLTDMNNSRLGLVLFFFSFLSSSRVLSAFKGHLFALYFPL